MSEGTRKRRRYRFSLRALLVFMVVLGTVFGWVGARLQRARKQKETVAAIEKLGGIVGYYSWWPSQLNGWVDRDFFAEAVGVEFWYVCDDAMRPHDPPKPVTDESIEELIVALPNLEFLSLGKTRITDAGLAHLTQLPKLEILWFNHTQVTDAGLEHLKGLPNLECLWLQDTKVTDAGVHHLKGLTELKQLDLQSTHVTDEGIKKLQLALPNCEIYR